MIRWRVPRPALKRAGIENAYQLAKASGISYPTAAKLIELEQPWLEKVDVATLEAVAKALGVKRPLDLLEWMPG